MKSIIAYSILICSFFAACNAQQTSSAGGSNDSTDTYENDIKTGKKISKRDFSITKANAYSDLFLDSAALDNFIKEKALPDSFSRRIRSFYNARNFQFAWFSSDGLTEQARGFWNLHDYHTTYSKDTTLRDKALQKKMDNLIAEEDLKVSGSDKSMINTELTLTYHFIVYTLNNYEDGYVKRKEMERFVPRKKESPLELADSLLNKKHKDNKYFADVNKPYKLLKDELAKYYQLAKAGGWQPINTTAKSIKKGTSSPTIASIKRRLALTGDLVGGDTSQMFNDTLETAVKNFQVRHGYSPTGVITPAIIKEMNVSAADRIEQILMNMERMRWMPGEPSGNLILVNIPEFVLHVYEGDHKAFDMNVVVGKEGHNTTMFTGDLNQIVFSPYWNVPPSIVKKEIVPKMNADPNYLAKQNMEITGNEGGLPVIRQKPGGNNALGNVKFLFPNSFNIYFHDTPSKSLFSQDKRAYSHGCIRLSQPQKMAEYLLRDSPEWTPEKIEEAMNSGNQQFVRLKKPVPVFITYYTAWVDDNGQLNFREDIYKHDSDLAQKMFTSTEQLARR